MLLKSGERSARKREPKLLTRDGELSSIACVSSTGDDVQHDLPAEASAGSADVRATIETAERLLATIERPEKPLDKPPKRTGAAAKGHRRTGSGAPLFDKETSDSQASTLPDISALTDPTDPKQPPVEDLGEWPPRAKPFAFLVSDPGAATPAHKSGLRRGDAVLAFGGAVRVMDVQSALQGSLNRPLRASVVDVHGRYLCKSVVPCVWDRFSPASLLGCELSDSCPFDLKASHPVFSTRQGVGVAPAMEAPSNPSSARSNRYSAAPTSQRYENAIGGQYAKKPSSLLTGRYRVDSGSERFSHGGVRPSGVEGEDDESAHRGGRQRGDCSISGCILFLMEKFRKKRSSGVSVVRVRVNPNFPDFR